MNKINDRIKFIRKSQNLSQEELGKKINLSRSQIGCYENAYRNIPDRSINDICKVFNINKEWLLNGTGDMYNSNNNINYLEIKEIICENIMQIDNIESLTNIKNLSALLLNFEK